MAGFLEKLIPRLTTAVVQAEIPRAPAQRRGRRTTARQRPRHGASAHGPRGQRHGGRRAAASGPSRASQTRAAKRQRRARARARRTTRAATTGRAPARRARPPAARPRVAARVAQLPLARLATFPGGADRGAAGALACEFDQSHRPRNAAWAKSLKPAVANTAVTVRPARGCARRKPDEAERGPCADTAAARDELAHGAPHAAAAGPLAAGGIVDERLAHPRADLLAGDHLRDRERRRGQAGSARCRAARARPPRGPRVAISTAASARAVDRVERAVLGRPRLVDRAQVLGGGEAGGR